MNSSTFLMFFYSDYIVFHICIRFRFSKTSDLFQTNDFSPTLLGVIWGSFGDTLGGHLGICWGSFGGVWFFPMVNLKNNLFYPKMLNWYSEGNLGRRKKQTLLDSLVTFIKISPVLS